MRRCGKPTCACGDPAHPGHGPQHILTKKVENKTVSVHLKAGPELEKVTGEVGQLQAIQVARQGADRGQRGYLRGEADLSARRGCGPGPAGG